MGTALLTARDADGDVDTLSFSWTVASPNASTTGTVLSTTPNPTTGHDFNVVGAYSGPRTYYRLRLIEAAPWGHSRVWYPTGIPFTQPVTNRVNGAYTYVLAGCYRDTTAILSTAYQVCEQIGEALTVTVAGAATDPVSAQLADTYEVRSGHLDDDSLKDLYVRRTSSAAGGGLFEDVILQQAAGGEFTLVAAPPGSAHATKASTEWAVTEAVGVVLNDINLDGFADVLLRGLNSVVAGAPDRILYAPGRRGGPTEIQKAVDDELKDFLTEVQAWAQNPNFFNEKLTTETVYSHQSTTACFGIPGGDLEQTGLPPWLVTVSMTFSYCITSARSVSATRQIPTNDSPHARGFAGQFEVVNGRIDPDLTLGSQRAKTLSGILEDVLGVETLNGNLEQSCPQTQTMVVFDQFEIWCDNVTAFGRMIIHLIAGIDRKVKKAPQPGRGLSDSEIEFLEGYGPLESGTFSYDELRIVPRSREFFRENDATHSTAYVTATEPHIINVRNSDYKESYDPAKIEDVESLGVILHEVTHTCQFLCEGWKHGRHPMEKDMQYVYRVLNTALHDDLNFEVLGPDQQAEIIHDRMRTNEGLQPYRAGNILEECAELVQPPGTGCVDNGWQAVPISVMRGELNGLSIPGAATVPPNSD